MFWRASRLDEAAVHFDLIGLDEPEGDANGRSYTEESDQRPRPPGAQRFAWSEDRFQ